MNFEKKSVEQIKAELLEKLSTNFGSGLDEATDEQIYQALALMVRERSHGAPKREPRRAQTDGREEGVLPKRRISGWPRAA